MPLGFGPHGGEIWVADEDSNAVHAVRNISTPSLTPLLQMSSLTLTRKASTLSRTLRAPTAAAPSSRRNNRLNQLVWAYPLSDFIGLGGNVLVTSEAGIHGADTSLVTFDGTNYVQTSFGPRVPGVNEGSSFVDCDVPTPTPTPTPTATFTPTATATATATSTATATATRNSNSYGNSNTYSDSNGYCLPTVEVVIGKIIPMPGQ